MIATKSGVRTRKLGAKVPKHLIYEIIDGQPIHYWGYRDVVEGNKTFEEIMGSNKLQSVIILYLLKVLIKGLNEDDFEILSSEAGLHLDKRNNLAGDVMIFDRKSMPVEEINEHYADVPPRVAIEVDIRIDPADMQPDTYLFKKTQKLLDFGVEKVIWITTQAKKVTTATPNAAWEVKDWHEDTDIIEGIVCNVGQYLMKRGSAFA